MTREYQQLPGLEAIVLEESYVLDIEAHPTTIEFAMDFVLTAEHRDYRPPLAGEMYCTRRGVLTFSGVTRCLWSDQGAPPARDATGEVDFGHIDSLLHDPAGYALEGDWGRMEVRAERVAIRLT